jgi:periplasmic protein TonB
MNLLKNIKLKIAGKQEPIKLADVLFMPQPKKFINHALIISLLVHALALTLKIVEPYIPSTKNMDSPLEVSLVNSQSEEAPDKADLLAQSNLKGGGEHDKNAYTTPLPATGTGDADLMEMLQKQSDPELEQKKLLTVDQSQEQIIQNIEAKNQAAKQLMQGQDAQSINQEIARLEAEIARQVQKMAKRPKRLPLTATNSKAVVYARYYDQIRGRIESYGTANFPRDAAGNPLYGDLVLVIRINKQGILGYNRDGYTVTAIDVARSSGDKNLDQQAIEIVKNVAPFGPFTVEMEKTIDILEVISTFRFNKRGFETSLQGR